MINLYVSKKYSTQNLRNLYKSVRFINTSRVELTLYKDIKIRRIKGMPGC